MGVVQNITFVAFDKWANVPRVAATRQVTIISPCSDDKFYCEGDDICSDIACDARNALPGAAAAAAAAVAAAVRPVLLLIAGAAGILESLNASTLANLTNVGSGPYYNHDQQVNIPYGRPAPYSFLPCNAVENISSCGAVAADTTDGDLSASIKV